MRVSLREYANLLSRYLGPQWFRVVVLSAFLLSSIGLQLVNPQIMRSFLDTAQAGGAMATLIRTALLFIGVAVAQQIVSVLAAYFSENLGWIATNALRADLVAHCLRLDMAFHNARTPGEMIERVDGDVTALTNFFSQFVIQVVGNVLLLVGILVLLFRIDWRVGSALSFFALATLLILGRFRNIAVPHWRAERQASAELFGYLEERLAGTEDIRANAAEAYVMRNFYRLMRELMRRSLKAALMVNIVLNSTFFLFALGTAAAFATGAWLFERQMLTIGTVYIVFFYTNMLERPIRQITRQMETLQKAGAGLVRVQELFAYQPQIRDDGADCHLPSGALSVEFRNVAFGYDDAQGDPSPAYENEIEAKPLHGAAKEMVLRDLSFCLEPGTVLGLLGRTGSGKTTLSRLIFRLYDLDRGVISLGRDRQAISIGQVPLPELRQRVGMVTQNIQLFHASVRDNLTFFDPGISDDQILEVIHNLGLGTWYRSLPHGLDTELEAGGSGLSAGEAQLLAFARIFLQDPGLVILDEASSRLDPATERLIERAVDRLLHMPERTAIIIAHRLGTVQRADRIMILEDGHIAEYGPRAVLASDPASRFYHLLQTGLEEMLA
jgi:ATP-binding cassette subfamily B protein